MVAGSLAKRLGLKDGAAIEPAIIEFYYKDDALGDPFGERRSSAPAECGHPAVLREMRER